MKRWKVIKRGEEPRLRRDLEFTCVGCWRDSLLEVNREDTILAQVEAGLVTDLAPSVDLMPLEIECPHCQRRYERGESNLRQTV